MEIAHFFVCHGQKHDFLKPQPIVRRETKVQNWSFLHNLYPSSVWIEPNETSIHDKVMKSSFWK